MNPQENQKKNSNRTLIWIIVLLVIALGISGYFLTQSSSDVTNLEIEKEALLFDLKELRRMNSELESTNDSVDAYIVSQDLKYAQMIDSISNLQQADAQALSRIRDQVFRYKRQNRELAATVDSLNLANKRLSREKEEVEMNLAQEMARTENLSQTNRMLQKDVEMGKLLQLTTMNAGAYRVRNSGAESETQRARRADRVKGCFRIGKNMIADKGEKLVYMRVTTPEGRVISDGAGEDKSFDFNGNPMLFSAKQSIWFEGEPMEMCMFVDNTEDFETGEYTVEIFTDGYKLGEGKFSLN